jgi:ketosteroid isomerase-like protein
LKIRPLHTHVSEGEEAGKTTAVVEMEAVDAKCQNGLAYDMRYCWVAVFDDASGMIERVRAYVDTDLANRAIEGNPR